MKKIILALTIGLLLISCSSSDDSGSSSGTYKWSFKLDGVLYQWSGNHLTGGGAIEAGGQATYSGGAIALQKTNSSGTPIISVTMNFPTTSTGSFVFNSSNTSQAFTLLNNQLIYSTIPVGGAMNVNISSLSNVTFVSNPTNPGKVIGTFSGTLESLDGTSTATITEGTFEAVRAQ
jgi:hypothetical protein